MPGSGRGKQLMRALRRCEGWAGRPPPGSASRVVHACDHALSARGVSMSRSRVMKKALDANLTRGLRCWR
jgi:hypothetical protein